jgi:L-lactate dehydrogenase complex protein LldG
VTAREEILARVGRAVAGSPQPEVPRRYRQRGDLPHAQAVEKFIERVQDYRAAVVETNEVPLAVAEALAAQAARRIGIPADLDERLRPAGVELVEDELLSARELDELDGALTTCAAACAVTGTIALDGGPGQGRRALTLVPDLHVCIVGGRQIVETVPEFVRRLEPAARQGRPIVLVSGPSATSDIELQRVEGVHGPRRLVVIVDR